MEPNDQSGSVELLCKLENVQALVDALQSIKWKKNQDAHVELSELGLAITVLEANCLQGRVYFKSELFQEYEFHADPASQSRFGVSLSLLIDCLQTFTSLQGQHPLEMRYPGPDMELLLSLKHDNLANVDAELRTRITEDDPRDLAVDVEEPVAMFAIQSAALKEALEDLEWPNSSVELSVTPQPPVVTFKADGHGGLQIDFCADALTDLFIAFQCDHPVSFRYKYKHLRATTAQIPAPLLKDSRGTKLTVDAHGRLKIQHLVNVRLGGGGAGGQHGGLANGFGGTAAQTASKTSYIEFYVLPEEEADLQQQPLEE